MTNSTHLEAIEKELNQIESSNAWNEVYQKIRSEGNYNFDLSTARTAQNRHLNRYRDVLPFDHSRIILQHSTDYINASLVKVESISRKYILTQGPLPSTTSHFWLMIWQQQVKGIIMLNKIIEKNMIKCHQYWPLGAKNNGKDVVDYTDVGLSISLESEAKHHHYIYRTFRVKEISTGESREVLHFHYTTWPDFGVPQDPEAFSKFLSVVIKSGCLEDSVGPAVVHCSAGIGRSGTFCLVDTLLQMLDKGLCSTNVGLVIEVLLDMRRYRMGLIQTPEQLRFSYQAIVHGAKQRLQKQLKKSEAAAANNNSESGGCINTNDTSSPSSSVCTSEDEDDLPPPRPPPRTDSLTRSMLEEQLLSGSEDEDQEQDSQANPVDLGSDVLHESLPDSGEKMEKELPPTPSSPEESEDTPPAPPPRGNNHQAQEINQKSPTSEEKTPETNGLASTTPQELATRMAKAIASRRKASIDRNSSIAAKVSSMKKNAESRDKWEEKKRPTDAECSSDSKHKKAKR